MVKIQCEECGKNQKRYRSAFSSWICDNCKKETQDYTHPDSSMSMFANNWWGSLTKEHKIKIYLENENTKNN